MKRRREEGSFERRGLWTSKEGGGSFPRSPTPPFPHPSSTRKSHEASLSFNPPLDPPPPPLQSRLRSHSLKGVQTLLPHEKKSLGTRAKCLSFKMFVLLHDVIESNHRFRALSHLCWHQEMCETLLSLLSINHSRCFPGARDWLFHLFDAFGIWFAQRPFFPYTKTESEIT